MTTFDLLGIVAIVGFVFIVIMLVMSSRLPSSVKLIICIGIVLRVVGSVLRYEVLYEFYGGRGDAVQYFREGWDYAVKLREIDFSPILQIGEVKGPWWGTNFLTLISGCILAIIGPSMLSEFMVFALLSFVGLLGFGVAFHRAYPDVPWVNYLRWIWLFPSLWFWPASVGKEAILLLGLGVAVMGFVGRRERIQWFPLLAGLAIVLVIRAQLLGIVLVAMVVSQWFSFAGRWSFSRAIQTVALSAIVLVALNYSMQLVGIEQEGWEGIESYVENEPARRSGGNKTTVAPVAISLRGAPLAALNVYLRPFLWEATSLPVAISSLEVVALMGIILARRRNLYGSLRYWRSDRIVRLALAFMIIYPIALGMVATNVGLLARQRIFLFPFVFLLLEARPRPRGERARNIPESKHRLLRGVALDRTGV